ncbi:MAG TPA: carboxypeptidase-like regulatory domain-containing protein, partial [Bacteroidota bacterium]|nr:carboxypeptidase-like regulatory domain-containing protein [Bacteroidota bacterium]
MGQTLLRGTVVDSTTGDPLIGVNIVVQGTSLGAATDIDGQFRVAYLPARLVIIKASCVGYESKLTEVDFSKNKEIQIDIHMRPSVIQGEEVIVTAQMHGQIAAMNQQITSNTIINVVSEEKIKELPDANAAEAIGRLPGVAIVRNGGEASEVVLRGLSSKYSNITVDGVKIPATDADTRDVDLSTMSQGSLAGIELYKTLTPDQDADAIAGTINLVTRKAPTERELRFDLMGDYNNLMNSAKQYDFQVRYGERFFNNVLGIQLQGNLESKIRSKENISYDYLDKQSNSYIAQYPNDAHFDYYMLGSFTSTFTDEQRTRQGIQGIIDLNTPDSGSIKFEGMYSGTGRNITTNSRVYVGADPSSYWDYNYDYKELRISTTNASLQGKNYFGGFELNWCASYARSATDNPYDFALKFTEPGGGKGVVVSGGGDQNLPPVDVKTQLIDHAVNNFVAAACSTGVYTKQNNADQEKTAYLNVTKEYTLGNIFSGELKFGGKYKEKNRWMTDVVDDDNNYLHGYASYPSGIDTTALLSSRFASYYNSTIATNLNYFIDTPPGTRNLMGTYPFSPLINVDALKQWYSLFQNANSKGNPEFISSAAGAITDYNVTERVSSAYLMNTFNFGQFSSFIAGVRVEQESNDYIAKYSTGALGLIGIAVSTSSPLLDSTAHFTQTIWLPNLQWILRPTDFLNVRLAAYKAIARPDYNLRLPQFYDQSQSGNQILLTSGNQNLKDMEAWNFEANTQIFGGSIGLISVSVFEKKIDNFIHVTDKLQLDKNIYDSLSRVYNLVPTNPAIVSLIHQSNTMLVVLPYNDNLPTYVWGIEFEHQVNFNFLPGLLKNISLSYNASLTRSLTHIFVSKTITYVTLDSSYNKLTKKWTYSNTQNYIKTYEVDEHDSEGQPKLYGNAALGY